MRIWLIIIVLMLSHFPALAAEPDKPCDITVTFTSQCCGTDFSTYKKVKAILEERAALATYRRIPWGKEGEFTLCISAEAKDLVEPLYTEIKDVLPTMSEPTRGKTTIRLRGGKSE